MKYLKTPKESDKFNIRIQVKDSNGTVSETIIENCRQFTVDEIAQAIEIYPHYYSSSSPADAAPIPVYRPSNE